MNRLSAFTLVELTLVLVLGAIVSAMVFHAVQVVTRMHQNFSMRQQSLSELRSMYTMLYLDIERAQRLTVSNDTLMLFFNVGVVTYAKSQNSLVRRMDSHPSDSLPVATVSVIPLAKGVSGLPTCVIVSITRDEEEFQWRFCKQYSSEQILFSDGFN